jgi:serine/threonine-protein kinase
MVVWGLGWGPDNSILFSDLFGGGIKQVSADGGNPALLIKGDLGNMGKYGMPVAPQLLSDGNTILYTNAFNLANAAGRQIVVQSLESGERKVLFQGSYGRYIPTGHILYESAANLVAVPFDIDTLEAKSSPVPLLEGTMACAFSDAGTLVYVSQPENVSGSPGYTSSPIVPSNASTLVWVDRKGLEEPIKAPPYQYRYPKISPDGTKIALNVAVGDNMDIWVWDLARNTLSRLTFDPGPDLQAIWTPDGKKIVFAAVLGIRDGIYWKAADGTGEEEKLASLRDRVIMPFSWSRDGKILVISETEGFRKWNLSIMSMEGNHELKPLLMKSGGIQPQVSPDGRWIAYVSAESGKNEIYVRPFPDVNKGKWQISTEGGNSPRWSPDGSELFYLIGNTDAVMSVAVESDPTFKPGNPKVLFRGKYLGSLPANGVPWDVHPDGKRFLMIKEIGKTGSASVDGGTKAAGPRKINIVVNWFEELKQRVPAK